MLIVFKILWGIAGVGVIVQSVYWAVCYAGWGLGYFGNPNVSADWITLAFAGNALFMLRRTAGTFGYECP